MKRELAFSLLLFATVAKAEMEDRTETTLIVVHHSDTECGNVEAFRKFHKETNGWDDIGYHFVITNGQGGPDGQIQMGRALQKQGAHAENRNRRSIGICLVGKETFTERQKESAIILISALCIIYKIEPSEGTIQGHHEECPGPGINLSQTIEWVRECLKVISQKTSAPRKEARGFFYS